MTHLIAPSLLSANFLNLQNDIEMINASKADWFHIDVMDGTFVPNISFGFPIIKQIKKSAKKPLDVHLMIVHPENYLETFKEAGADCLSVHYEACDHLDRTINQIKKLGMKAGVVLNPHTNVILLEDVITELDFVCLMSVNPGFGGQKFIENTYSKIKALKKMIISKNSKALIEVDGGVDVNNASKLFDAGADILVAGNAVFGSIDPIKTIEVIKGI
ncbi:MAG: ribulose-phosphate 3-epimerase [Bacteroidetes bacterium]|nr:ribulose-phosphate 3-epimerase [Bacteroidota bacterium]